MNYKRILKNNNEIYEKVITLKENQFDFIEQKWNEIEKLIGNTDLEEISKNELDTILSCDKVINFYQIQEELLELYWDIESINYELKMKYPSISERMSTVLNNLYFIPSIMNMSYVKSRITSNFLNKIGFVNPMNIQYYPEVLPENAKRIFDFLNWLIRFEHLKNICQLILRLVSHINCNYVDVDD